MGVLVAEIEIEIVFIGDGAARWIHASVLQVLGTLSEPIRFRDVLNEDEFGLRGWLVFVHERLLGGGEGFGIFGFEEFEGAVRFAGQAVNGVILSGDGAGFGREGAL